MKKSIRLLSLLLSLVLLAGMFTLVAEAASSGMPRLVDNDNRIIEMKGGLVLSEYYEYDASGAVRTKAILSYSDKNAPDSGIVYRYNTTKEAFVAFVKYTFTYDADGYMTTEEQARYNAETEEFVASYKRENVYDSRHNVTADKAYETDDGTLRLDRETKYSYGTYGVSEEESFYYDETAGAMVKNSKVVYTYDGKGRLSKEERFNASGETYNKYMLSEYQYDDNDNCIETVQYRYQDETWVQYNRQTVAYSENKEVTTSYSWSGTEWTVFSSSTTEMSADGKTRTSVQTMGDPPVNSTKYVTTMLDDSTHSSSYEWQSDAWVVTNDTKTREERDAAGNVTVGYGQTYDVANSAWKDEVISRKYVYVEAPVAPGPGPNGDGSGLGTGAIIGIVAGSLVLLLLIVYVIGYLFFYRKGKLDGHPIAVIYCFLPKEQAENKEEK